MHYLDAPLASLLRFVTGNFGVLPGFVLNRVKRQFKWFVLTG